MLNLYRRHTDRCKYVKESRPSEFTKCTCPIWCYGIVEGREVRRSVKLRDWQRATKRVADWERTGELKPTMALEDAITSYLGDCRRRNLQEPTIESYKKTLSHLSKYLPKAAIEAITLEEFTRFTAERKYTPLKKGSTERPITAKTAIKELETYRAFFRFCLGRKWVAENIAKQLGRPKDNSLPTLPFEPEEVSAILRACEELQDGNPNTRDLTRLRAKARVLVMLYTGLRISDVVSLKRGAINWNTGRLHFTAKKTGSTQSIIVGPEALAALKELPSEGLYFFWNGESRLRSAIGAARQSISRILRTAGVKGHPHRFRDTFSVELLKSGADIRTVSLLLGHSSIKTTEKHYAPWVHSFQVILDSATAKLSFGGRTKIRTIDKGGQNAQ